MPSPGLMEISLLVILVFVLFGAGRMSVIVRLIGRCVASFRQGKRDADAIDITPGKDR